MKNLAKRDAKISVMLATLENVAEIVAVTRAAGENLARRHGEGVWLGGVSEGMERYNIGRPKFSKTLIARAGREAIGIARLATKKPWAIDVGYFTKAAKPIYLAGMAVHPNWQGKGVGRTLLEEAEVVARAWPADAIRLDAFDGPAGAGEFYAKSGYRELAHVKYKNSPLIYYELLLK
jgi:GNAT superfamily N-acetyltransferase